MKDLTLGQFWNSVPRGESVFDFSQRQNLPDAARLYLSHAISPRARSVQAVRLRMHGEIKLGDWAPFRAEEVIRWDRGFIWEAATTMNRLPIRGYDRFVDGSGEMRWKLVGLIPIIKAGGPDITRSAAGRLAAESVWLPSVLASRNVTWTSSSPAVATADLNIFGEKAEIQLTVEPTGKLHSMSMQRWGNPGGGDFGWFDFGALVEQEAVFEDFTIPTELRIGWYFGTSRFESEGEFFRCTVDDATFR